MFTPVTSSALSRRQPTFLCTPRTRLLGLLGGSVVFACSTALAQAPEPSATSGIDAKTERIIHHDRGSRIEELRVGGQTRSIQVDTNSQLPGYQVQPIDPAQSSQDKGAAGKSSWRVIRF